MLLMLLVFSESGIGRLTDSSDDTMCCCERDRAKARAAIRSLDWGLLYLVRAMIPRCDDISKA